MNVTPHRFLALSFAVCSIIAATGLPTFATTSTHLSPRSALLRASDLGIGWTPHRTRASLGVGCLRAVVARSARHGVTTARASFVDNANPPEVTDVVAHFTTTTSAARAFDRVVTALRTCHRVHGYFSGHLLRGTVRTLRVAHFNSAEAAFSANARVAGVVVVEDLVVMRRAHVIVAVAEGNVGAIDVLQFTGVAERALSRARILATRP